MIAPVLIAMSLVAPGLEPQSSRENFEAFERRLAHDLPVRVDGIVRDDQGRIRPETQYVELPDGRSIPVFVLPPPDFEPTRRWPMILAMHGGPTRDPSESIRGAIQMLSVWSRSAGEAGWIVVAPAMTHVVARAPRTRERLPYEILTADQMEAILKAVTKQYPIDGNRIVSTGISLGSNFSIAFAASRPDRFAAIVPVSTEGESRELLLRNLMHVPVFALEGALDRNIRDIQGPRAMKRILDRFEYDVVYREFPDRSHEGFREHYPEVLEWVADRPRTPYPSEVLRVPHTGIIPLARRVHWIESDTRRGLVRARVTNRHRIEVEARWARSVRVYLHDDLIDLDAPFEIHVQGERAYRGSAERSTELAAADAEERNEVEAVYAAFVDVRVPTSAASIEKARAFSDSLRPREPAGPLSYWEMYAVRALEERLPPLGIEGKAISLDVGELAAIRVDSIREGSAFEKAGLRRGDLLLEVAGEPFFEGDTVDELHGWLARELDTRSREVELLVRRQGSELPLRASLSLEPF